MIDETLQDQAALHALGMLEGEEATAFQSALATQPELRTLVDEISESAAAITHALPAAKAPMEVLTRLLTQIRAEQQHSEGSRQPTADASGFNWMPAAIAASIAITAAVAFYSGMTVSRVNSRSIVIGQKLQLEQAESERQRLATAVAAFEGERVALERRIEDLRRRDAISQVQIATLKVQVKAYANVAAYVIWDANAQQGLMRFDKLPPAAPDKDYQMWVIDPRYDAPVSAGIFTTGAGPELDVRFKPTQPIALANKFAVSVEQKGGSATPQGQIVLMSK